ncbi:23S rRNA (adenine(2030)-N(6))-methyltransferase RlmJ [Cellvibrio sp. ARAG 10.3]|uniref:23S rRNA (adenine(2030)-N(6))-methyltransferase RlmJ n=1 Tax=Cellvibrio sp. ARAG 10.3 TaxID=3451358 RepID=UPI003F46756A
MLSYRHAFHAGNFADVLKHSVWLHTLSYLQQKDKPLRIIDTHAGAGGYHFGGHQPIRNREYDNGIGQLWQKADLPPLLATYVKAVQAFNAEQTLAHYPGSPLLAQALLRPQDRLFLHELHSTDCRLLRDAIGKDPRVKIIEEDGFQGLQALLPPPDRRGLVLIDPSYEIKSDYQHLVRQVISAHQRFATGTYLIWYPVVLRQRIDEMERALQKSGIRNIQLFEFGIAPDHPDYGMSASGMIVINPPWTLWAEMEAALPYLADQLAKPGEGHYRQVQVVPE